MARIAHVHHVDKYSFLNGNIELGPNEVYLVFDVALTMRRTWNKLGLVLIGWIGVMLLSRREGIMRGSICMSVGRQCVSTPSKVGPFTKRR
jgi:hypothetical protein